MNYSAFIITYNRPLTLINTIEALLNQTIQPSEILVVDNSDNDRTSELIKQKNIPSLSYYKVNYNSGPAGGAFFGLQILSNKKKDEWILWVDDDNPPESSTLIEEIFDALKNYPDPKKIGVIGSVGSDFNFKRGELRRFTNEELLTSEFLEASCIAGGMFPLIRADIIRQGILPNKDFFFGFEDLDFCLKVKKHGYKVIVPSKVMISRRKYSGSWNLDSSTFRFRSFRSLNHENAWRQYYSIRNMVYLFTYQFPSPKVILRYFIKTSIKSIFSLSNGVGLSVEIFYLYYLGFFHGLLAKLGMTVKPRNKRTIR